MAGDGGGDTATAGLSVLGLAVAVGHGQQLLDHSFEFPALQAYGSGFDGEGAGAKGFSFEAVVFEFLGDLGERDHLRWQQIDQQWHQQALTLHLLGIALAHHLFEQDALVGNVLIDDPETFFVDCQDEGVAQLAERLQGGEGVQGVGNVGGAGGGGCGGVGVGVRVAYRDGAAGEGQTVGRGGDGSRCEREGSGVGEVLGRVAGRQVGGEQVARAKERRVGGTGHGADVEQKRAGSGVWASGEGGGEAGSGAGLHQRGADGIADEVVDEAGLAETDFGLGRMNVDVHLLRGHLQKQQHHGEAGGRKDVAVGLAECVEDQLVTDEALIDEDVDGVAIEFLQLGLGDEAGEAEVAGVGWGVVGVTLPGGWLGQSGVGEVGLGGGGEHQAEGVLAEDLEEPLAVVGHRGCDQQSLGGGVEFEVAGGVGQGVMGDEGGDVGELSLLGLEELAAGGGVEEEVADGEGGTGWEASVFNPEDVAAGDLDQGTGSLVGGSGLEGEAGDAGDRRQGLTTEAEGGDGEQIVGGAELAGGVALEGEQGVVADHAVTIIDDANELAATGFDLDADAGGTGVEGVFEQLFDDGGGAFDDFASSDLVRHEVGENADAAHDVIVDGGMAGLGSDYPPSPGILRKVFEGRELGLDLSVRGGEEWPEWMRGAASRGGFLGAGLSRIVPGGKLRVKNNSLPGPEDRAASGNEIGRLLRVAERERLFFLFGGGLFGLLGFAWFGIAVAYHVQAHEVGGTGAGAGSGDDADDLTFFDVAEIFEDLFGHADQFVGIAEAFAEDGIGTPEHHAAIDDVLEGRECEDGRLRVVLGEQSRGAAGLGKDGDGGDFEIFGGVSHTFADGLCDGEAGGAGQPGGGVGVDADLVLGLDDDFGHHGNGFDGILACGGLTGEHDGVGSVVDGVGNVRGLGACRPGVLDHGLEHLGRGDDWLAVLGCATDDVLLDGGDFFGWDFDAEVSAGDHDAVGDLQDGVEVLDGLWLFEFGDDPGVGLEDRETIFDVAYVVGGAHEGDGYGIDTLADGKDEVFLVLLGKRGDFDGDTGEIDAFVLAEGSAVDDLADDVYTFDGFDAKFNQAVGEQDAGAGLKIFRERGEGGSDHGRGACDLARGDGEALASDELDGLVILEFAGADLGTLEVGEDTDRLALFLGDGAHHLDEFSLLGVGAVGEVETGHVEAGANQLAEDLGGAAGGAERGNNLGAAGEIHARRGGIGEHRLQRMSLGGAVGTSHVSGAAFFLNLCRFVSKRLYH